MPYLVSVTSQGDTLSPDLVSEKTVSREEFENFVRFSLNDSPIFSLECTEAGAVKKLTIDGNSFDGDDVQKAFSLKSNNFSLTYSENQFIFTVTGNGHGVGMSQYGADFMARQGAKYDEILKHYYTGVEIE
ncbi:MAG: SpoIID/LytB domain-containing protein [Clostridia bacterium]|nr:SpoIID/LytB domain-containing protein [Clostridia bacterium]